MDLATESSPEIVITLVHGTFARGADWCKADSTLCQTLTSALPQVLFNPFPWSGSNSLPKRLAATQQLQDHLTKQIAEFPTSRHYIIAHSHGGNIAWSSLSSSALQCSVNGLICLSTPFLHVRERNLYPLKLSRDIPRIVGAITFFAAFKLMVWLLEQKGLIPFLAVVELFVAYLLVRFVAIPLYQWAESFLQKVLQAMELPTLPSAKLLIIRMSGDEASAFLIASQFMSWAISQGFMIIVKPFSLAYVSLEESLEDDSSYIRANLRGFRAMLAILVSGIVLALLLPFFSTLVLVAIIPFGAHLALAHLFFEVTSESTPPGIWNIHQFGQSSFNAAVTPLN